MKKENKKADICFQTEFPFLLNISGGYMSQSKEILKRGFSYFQASMISDIVCLCSSKRQIEVSRSVQGEFSFKSSLGMSKMGIYKTIKILTNGKQPVFFLNKKNNLFYFKINFDFFSEVFDTEIRKPSDILKQKCFYQDKTFVSMFGYKKAFLLGFLLYKMHPYENKQRFVWKFNLSELAKEMLISKRNLNRIIKEISYPLSEIESIKKVEFSISKEKDIIKKLKKIKNLPSGKNILGIFHSKNDIFLYLDILKIRNFQEDFLKNLEIKYNKITHRNSKFCIPTKKFW